MPYHWTTITSSPPLERRVQVAAICRRHGGHLCENQIFYDDNGGTYALVQLPADETRQRALLDELGATSELGLVDADEKENGDLPPQAREAC